MTGRALLPDGMALTGRAVELVRGPRHRDEFAESIGMVGRTVRRMESHGATLHQALAIAGAELEAGHFTEAAYVLSMIGEPLPLSPTWSTDRGLS